MAISSDFPNCGNSITVPVESEKRSFCGIPSRHFSWVAAVIILLTSILLLSLEVGILVFFAIPTSLLFSVLIGVAIGATLILIGATLYHLAKKILKVTAEDAQFLEEKTQLIKQISLLQSQIEEEQLEIKKKEQAIELLKLSRTEKDEELKRAEESLSDLKAQLGKALEHEYDILRKQCEDQKQEIEALKKGVETSNQTQGAGAEKQTEGSEATNKK
ncbi:hypothetical protein [Chlamydia vaughanii]|uniref:hypothetical protein n=1 Tax=Chlamydia vaughanii TaxID=3112552 RepID=UPI0039F5DE54